MKKKLTGWLALWFGVSLMTAGVGGLQAGEEFVVTGKDWTESTETGKRGFLAGIATMIEVEREFQAGGMVCANSSIPTLHDGLSGTTLLSLKMEIDSYYENNPGSLEKPVIHVLWDIANEK